MGEFVTPPEEEVSPEVGQPAESRFGNKAELHKILEEGSPNILGRIETFVSVAPHRNVVEMAQVTIENMGNRNESDYVEITKDGVTLYGVFKPLSGEDTDFKRKNSLGPGYTREVAAYLVSEHFGLDLVPPTIVRTIGGRAGSLQLFLPEHLYRPAEILSNTGEESKVDKFLDSDDLQKMSVFDWVIANSDRHYQNYMFKIDENQSIAIGENDQPQVACIDNDSGFNSMFYRMKGGRRDIAGPYQFLTFDHETKAQKQNDLQPDMLNMLKSGLGRRQALDEALLSLPDIDAREISDMWHRVELSIDSEKHLSGYNYKSFETEKAPSESGL